MNHLNERMNPFSFGMDKEEKPDSQTVENKVQMKVGSGFAG